MQPIRATILVVDDSQIVRGLIVELLAEMGYQTTEAGDAKAALEAAERALPSVILCDMGLGAGMGGIELLRTIRQRFPHVKCVLMSGLFDETDLPDHAFTLLPKPFTREMLLHALDAA